MPNQLDVADPRTRNAPRSQPARSREREEREPRPLSNRRIAAEELTCTVPLRVTVLMGGPSAEREVSLMSGRAIADALVSIGHHVHCADAAPDNLAGLEVDADLVFIALHGTFGEDGQLQRILERRGMPFCGSGAQASALAMDKAASKRRFEQLGIPTPRWQVLDPLRLEPLLADWPVPAVLKPVAEGSSVGCRIAHEPEALVETAGRLVAEYGQCLIEEYIGGPELTVGILGEHALPPIEIRSRRGFYDYVAKYQDDETQYLFDPDVPRELIEQVQELSLRAFQALGCRDFGRVDWMISSSYDEAYVLEVNTIPGFTDHSLLPKAAARAGLGFAELCQRILALAMNRQR